jgi:hypothetical protein
VEYGVFKAGLGLLFFGSVFLFGFMQLAALRRDRQASRSVNDQRLAAVEPQAKQQNQ